MLFVSCMVMICWHPGMEDGHLTQFKLMTNLSRIQSAGENRGENREWESVGEQRVRENG